MEIRRIRKDDVNGFAELWKGVYNEGLYLRSPPPPIERIAAVLAKVEKLIIPQYVAVVENQVIGSMEAFPGTMCGHKTDSVAFLGAQVRRDYRRKGIGQALLTAVIQDCRRYGFSELKLSVFRSNKPAQKLYEKNGFEYCDETLEYSSYSAKEEPSLSMSLLLNGA